MSQMRVLLATAIVVSFLNVITSIDLCAQSAREKLSDAILDDDKDAVADILKTDVKIESRNEIKETPLAEALSSGSVEIVQFLIDRGADVNAKVYDEQTPLILVAASSGSIELVDALMKRRVNFRATDKYGQNAREEAAMSGDKTIHDRFAKAGLRTAFPLHCAAGLGDLDEIKRLLRAGQNVNGQTRGWRYTPIFFASSAGKSKAISLLLESKADPNLTSILKETPLHFAASGSDVEAVRLLLKGGADVNAKTKTNDTPWDWSHDDRITALLQVVGGKTGFQEK